MLPMSVTVKVLKPVRSSVFKAEHLKNMPAMLEALSVLKWLRSRLCKDSHHWNIYAMMLTLLVFRYSIPVMDCRRSMP